MNVIKRNGSVQPYDETRIIKILKKLLPESKVLPLLDENTSYDDFIKSFILSLKVYDGIDIEEIQNQLETLLMSRGFYKEAKDFILYRNLHSEERDSFESLKFLINYISDENAATSSKFDANANVETKNIATLQGELPKKHFIKLGRRMLFERLKDLYGKEFANNYTYLLENHFLYKNDETSIANYCASITMYPWLLNGLSPLGGKSTAPTNLRSFCGGFINLVFIVSSMLSGACATPEFLMYFDYFVRKEYGDDYYMRLDEVVEFSIKRRTLKKVITDCFEQIVYSINQPTGARNFQAVFWNVAYYDKYYFESMFGDFRFPDYSAPKWASLSVLQKIFMEWFNEERTKSVLTFPVETMALLYDKENNSFKDESTAYFTAEMYAKGHSFFTYISDSADSLSSCCFSKQTKVLVRTYNSPRLISFEDLDNEGYLNKTMEVFHNGCWVKGKLISLPNRQCYTITTSHNKEFVVTDNHLNPTLDGDKPTTSLTTNDYLLCNSFELPSEDKTSYNKGFLLGLYLSSGFIESKSNKPYIVIVSYFDLNYIKPMLIRYDYEEFDDKYFIRIYDTDIIQFIWKYCLLGDLSTDVLDKSASFRQGIIEGAISSSKDSKFRTKSELTVDVFEALATTLGIFTAIEKSEDCFEISLINTYNRINKDVYIIKNNSLYFKIKDIKKSDYSDKVYCFQMENTEEPYFTLPNGIITHNCRLRNEITTNEFSYTLGAGGVSTGSKSVLTLNINRCVQYACKNNIPFLDFIESVVDIAHKAQIGYNENLKMLYNAGMLPLFTHGYINMSRQYLTIGINGMVEAAQFLGIPIKDCEEYQSFVESILSLIERYNKKYKTDELMFNCEMIPAENVGVKHSKWDKEDGYETFRDCYNSYFYLVEDPTTTVLDKLKLHGRKYIQHLTGGSALHLNLEEHLSKTQYLQLLKNAALLGCNYLTFNIPNTICNDCGHIDKRYLKECPECHSKNIDYLTRIIGYLKRVSNFSKARQVEASKRYYGHL